MSKKQRARRSPAFIIVSWIMSFLSAGLLYAAGNALVADFASFRSCSSNNGLSIHGCGKESLNIGDFVLIALFILMACLMVSLFTGSWRATKGNA